MITLNSKQKRQLEQVARDFGLSFIVTFGSAVSGKMHKESDLDIAVMSKKEATLEQFGNLFSTLSEIFRGENIDIRFLNDADPIFSLQVIKGGMLLYGDVQEYNQFKVMILKRYSDDGRKYFPFLEKLLVKNQRMLEKSVYAG